MKTVTPITKTLPPVAPLWNSESSKINLFNHQKIIFLAPEHGKTNLLLECTRVYTRQGPGLAA